MNCANHADASAVAYCRTCGKALCANCTRPVRGVIYCEDCLGTRMEGVMPGGAPAAGFVPGAASAIPPMGAVPPVMPSRPIPMPVSSGPNPTVAGILAGVFPFGVGAVYTGQYAKGLAHLAIFVLLVAGCSVNGSEALPIICGFGIAFFVVYQIFDAVRSARALQAGLPPPDPYGLAASFGVAVSVGGSSAGGTPTGASPTKADSSSKIPTSAIILILLGALFLLHTAGLFENGFDKFWPVLLMGLGAWLFARNYGLFGTTGTVDPRTCNRKLVGPAMIFVIGTLCLLDTTNVAGFHRTWPVILLFVGVAKLLQGTGSGTTTAAYPPDGFVPPPAPPGPFPPPSVTPPAASSDAKSTEVNHG